MGVFSGPPKSFNLDRKSKFALELKSFITHHLNLLSSDLSDDVLAEYVTVLVCNAKNQNQAREDLEVFLGGKTQKFVSWLWKFLLKNETRFTAMVSSDQKDKTSHSSFDTDREKADASGTFVNSKGNSESVNLMDECEESCCSPRQASKSDDMGPPKDHHPLLPKELTNIPMQSNVARRKVANFDSLPEVLSSVGKYQTARVDDFEKTPFLEQRDSAQIQAPAFEAKPSCHRSNKDCAGISGRPMSSPERIPDFGTHVSNVSNLSVGPSSHIGQSRQSVWDRLGKPRHDAPLRRQVANFYEKEEARCSREEIDKKSPLISKPAKQIGQVTPLPLPRVQDPIAEEGGAHKIDDNMRLKHIAKIDSEVPSMSHIGKKRQFNEISSKTDTGLETEKRADDKFKQACQSDKISEVSSEASLFVVPQVDLVKLRLRQIEKEMAKLRAKQVSLEKDGNTNLLTNSGMVKPTEDESRTVLVTNVHSEATEETLAMYFQKCGDVVHVVISDNMPSTRERSAYITFQSKEDADWALRFSGASFYSRTIKVSRMGEIPSTTTTSAQIAGKNLQVSQLKSNMDPEGNVSCDAQPEHVAFTCDKTKTAAEDARQRGPLAATDSELTGETEQQTLND
ncbi:uncharacterized protein LOC104886729 isoform X1 [Beta vulgaris subsp. vulgaris]|uniref:uncharacterized protein LOC104886729 isoform X1 n=1 Tax=Beta vulgaris subsp. vulgaris TaxID=3555 RepID=UPI00203717AA|nr:uncharacterized protein LOC104886729 isoform X1 [Beta vulgaris subsp. vulgaris]